MHDVIVRDYHSSEGYSNLSLSFYSENSTTAAQIQ
jgi:hypothetical protein